MTATFCVTDARGKGNRVNGFMSHARDTSYKFLLGSVLRDFYRESFADYQQLLRPARGDLRE